MIANISRVVFIFFVLSKLHCGSADPDVCSGPPPVVDPHDCCEFPSFFEKSILAECGVQMTNGGSFNPPTCDQITCVFKKANVMTENNKPEGVKALLTKWTETNPEWAGLTDDFTNKCLSDTYLQSGPPGPCQPLKAILCMHRMIFLSCPASQWKSSAQCEATKIFSEQCSKD